VGGGLGGGVGGEDGGGEGGGGTSLVTTTDVCLFFSLCGTEFQLCATVRTRLYD
jgi:hypothetical protein